MDSIGVKLVQNYPYVASLILFGIGCFTVLTHSNLLKKVIGINIMESSIFLIFIAAGNIRGGAVPITSSTGEDLMYINPLPSALILTGIVVSVSVTAFALALIMKLYRIYGTIDAREIFRLRNEAKIHAQSNH